ncbi:MAG: GNAT family N-acetyltransferase [Pirellulales bacterium]
MFFVREAEPDDTIAELTYIEDINGQSGFLSFRRGEFGLTELQEQAFLRKFLASDNQLYNLGIIDDTIVSTLNFSAESRLRVQHSDEFGMSVQRQFWGRGIGSLMLNVLICWAKQKQIVTRINLRVRTDTQRAIEIYERQGFVKEGTTRKEFLLNGKYFDNYWMGLEL